MLSDSNSMATIAVKDLKKAKAFYEGTLGLAPLESEEESAQTYRSGDSEVLVYESQFAGTNQATAATWSFDGGLEDAVKDLKGKGVKFEHYEMPGMKLQGDVHVNGSMKAAWFKDPDGNILALVGH